MTRSEKRAEIRTKVKKIALILGAVWLVYGCGSSPSSDRQAAEADIKQGWIEYSRGNYASAISSFESALEKDGAMSDAHNGVGWSLLSMSKSIGVDDRLVLRSISEFQEAVRKDEANADGWVGLANALFLRRQDESDFQNAIKAIDRSLQSDRKFLYRHDYKLESDLRLLKAKNLYYLGETEKALDEIKLALNSEPDNKIALELEKLIEG